MTANFATEKFRFAFFFFTFKWRKQSHCQNRICRKNLPIAPSVCSATAAAAAGMKSVRFQNSSSNKSRREGARRRHLRGSAAPGLQHVAWRLSNSGRSTLDRLERFERQLGQLWGSAPTRSLLLPSQSGPISTSLASSPGSGLPLFALHLICPHLRWKMGSSFSP